MKKCQREKSSDELATLAEEGDPSDLIASYTGANGVLSTLLIANLLFSQLTRLLDFMSMLFVVCICGLVSLS